MITPGNWRTAASANEDDGGSVLDLDPRRVCGGDGEIHAEAERQAEAIGKREADALAPKVRRDLGIRGADVDDGQPERGQEPGRRLP